jgi:hypothetical protein
MGWRRCKSLFLCPLCVTRPKVTSSSNQVPLPEDLSIPCLPFLQEALSSHEGLYYRAPSSWTWDFNDVVVLARIGRFAKRATYCGWKVIQRLDEDSTIEALLKEVPPLPTMRGMSEEARRVQLKLELPLVEFAIGGFIR